MGVLAGYNSVLAFGDYSTSSSTQLSNMLGLRGDFPDADTSTTGTTVNSPMVRECVLVKNDSGSTIAAGYGLKFTAGNFGTKVTPCTNGAQVRLYAPAYIRGSTSNTIPANAYFWAVKRGPTTISSDGTVIAEGDGLVIGATTGQFKADAGTGAGNVYIATAASTALSATTTPTTFDKNYTFAANTLAAGDVIRVFGEVICTATNSTDTFTGILQIGSTNVATTGAIDVANNDTFTFLSEITIRTAGASGTLVASTLLNTATGNTTYKSIILGSTTVDTTATQLVGIQGTWSTNNAGNSARLDVSTSASPAQTSPACEPVTRWLRLLLVRQPCSERWLTASGNRKWLNQSSTSYPQRSEHKAIPRHLPTPSPLLSDVPSTVRKVWLRRLRQDAERPSDFQGLTSFSRRLSIRRHAAFCLAIQ